MSFERSHVIDHRRKIVTRNSNGREKWRVEVMVLHLESREEGFRPRSMNTTRMRPLLAKDSLHWKKPVNEGNSRGRIFRSQIKASSTRTSSSSRTIKKGVNPCERGYCLYRSDRPIGSASPRHARAFPYRGETRSAETKRLATDASRQAAHSIAEPRASSKNLARWRP
jgi:hypothetical protein